MPAIPRPSRWPRLIRFPGTSLATVDRSARSLLLPAMAMVSLLLSAAPGRSEVLYTLSTKCSVQGADPVACTVEAVDQGNATLYRHKIGSSVTTWRVTGAPVTMALWSNADKKWLPISNASARFSTNTVCINGTEFCVVNPNYLNSVREDKASSLKLAGRDLVKVHFGADGRIDASCYDGGCEVELK